MPMSSASLFCGIRFFSHALSPPVIFTSREEILNVASIDQGSSGAITSIVANLVFISEPLRTGSPVSTRKFQEGSCGVPLVST